MFHGGDNFYFMLGSAAAGLIGLLFVVVTLTAELEQSRVTRGATSYLTPTALHFGVVLSISAVAVAPELPAPAIALLIGLAALVGLASAICSSIGIRTPQPGMDLPHWSDFWTYGGTPAALYIGLCVAAVALGAREHWATHLTDALLLALLLVGIRNAWDLVTWIAPHRKGTAA